MAHVLATLFFVMWCCLLVVCAIAGATAWQGLTGESNGGAEMGKAVCLGSLALLIVSIVLKFV